MYISQAFPTTKNVYFDVVEANSRFLPQNSLTFGIRINRLGMVFAQANHSDFRCIGKLLIGCLEVSLRLIHLRQFEVPLEASQ
jgi:hypothetical protein